MASLLSRSFEACRRLLAFRSEDARERGQSSGTRSDSVVVLDDHTFRKLAGVNGAPLYLSYLLLHIWRFLTLKFDLCNEENKCKDVYKYIQGGTDLPAVFCSP